LGSVDGIDEAEATFDFYSGDTDERTREVRYRLVKKEAFQGGRLYQTDAIFCFFGLQMPKNSYFFSGAIITNY